MAQGNNGWGSFLQSRSVQIVLDAICTIFCAYYAVDAVIELATPERAAVVADVMGAPVYYVITVLRLGVCAWAAIAFGRMTFRLFTSHDDE